MACRLCSPDLRLLTLSIRTSLSISDLSIVPCQSKSFLGTWSRGKFEISTQSSQNCQSSRFEVWYSPFSLPVVEGKKALLFMLLRMVSGSHMQLRCITDQPKPNIAFFNISRAPIDNRPVSQSSFYCFFCAFQMPVLMQPAVNSVCQQPIPVYNQRPL